ncbi:carboxypeptidase regulatory-like domain-containing protein [Paenibacillus gorillae]|uniref:carboxypeptidase regulatory-like domain-containing protein n=1 Tax=Paenibacillus gorillae TaxID=1243662 RepID=UPI0004BC1281|nr:carboxypeptidase regulatory-like domain-containing protein [Paenibacillus gorillae]
MRLKFKKTSKKVFVSMLTLVALLVSLLGSSAVSADPAPDTGTVTGVINDLETNGPLSGVSVKLFAGADGAGGEEVGSIITGTDGVYTFDNVPTGKFYLNIVKEGYLSSNFIPNGNTAVAGEVVTVMPYFMEITLVHGIVKNTQGAEIGGVEVQIIGQPYYVVTPETSGYFQFSNVPHGVYTLLILKPGYQDLIESFTVLPGERARVSLGDITLLADGETPPPPKTVIGLSSNRQSVEVEAGQMAVAFITAHYSNGSSADVTSRVRWTASNPEIVHVASTGAIIGLKEGSTTITAALEDKEVAIPVVVTARPKPIGTGTVTGVVNDLATNAPLSGVEVRLFYIPGGGGIEVGSIVTDSDGTYTFKNVPEGGIFLLFRKDNYVPGNWMTDKKSINDETVTIEPYNMAFSQISGSIRDTRGFEIGGATVTVTGTEYQVTTPEQSGFFRLDNVPLGMHTLTITKEGYEPLVTESFSVVRGESVYPSRLVLVEEGESNPMTVLFLTADPSQLELQVGKTTKATIRAFYINATYGDVTSKVSWTSSNPSIVDVSSTGEIIGVSEGEGVTVTAKLGDKTVSIPVMVTTAPGSQKTGTVKGKIRDLATGEELSGASVGIYTGEYPGTLFETVVTDDNGLFVSENVPAGLFHLSVEKAGYVSFHTTTFSIVVKENEVTLVPDISAFYSQVLGTVENESNEAIGDAIVKVNGTDIVSATFPGIGIFSIFNIPDGTYTLTISKPGYKDLTTDQFTVEKGNLYNLNTLRMVATGNGGGNNGGGIGGGPGGGTPPVATPSPSPTPTASPSPTPSQKPEKPALDEKLVKAEAVREKVQKAADADTTVSFSDVKANSWSSSAIELAAKIGFVSGYEDGSFHADASVTRAEFASMLVKALGIESAGDASFADTQGHWAANAINALKANGIIGGYKDGSFKPNNEITRAEMVAILSKLLKLGEASGDSKFKDVTGSWAEAQINQLAEAGVISGKSEGKFDPNATATRAESVVMILRLLNITLDLGLKLY